MYIWSVTNDHVYTSYSFYQFGFCSANRVMYKYVISVSTYVLLLGLRFEKLIYRKENIYVRWFEKASFFSYSSNHTVSFLSSTNENAATYHEFVLLWRKYSFSTLPLIRKDLYTGCVIVFHLVYAICCMITHFFSIWVFSRTFMIHRTAGEEGGYVFNSSLAIPPASQTLRH